MTKTLNNIVSSSPTPNVQPMKRKVVSTNASVRFVPLFAHGTSTPVCSSHPDSCFTNKPIYQTVKSLIVNKPSRNYASNLLKLNRKLILSAVHTNKDINVSLYIIEAPTICHNTSILRASQRCEEQSTNGCSGRTTSLIMAQVCEETLLNNSMDGIRHTVNILTRPRLAF